MLIPDPRAGCSLAESITRGGCARCCVALSRRADRHLCQHLRGGEGGSRYLLHLGQRPKDRRIARRAAASIMLPDEYLAAERRQRDRGRNHRLGRPLRGARALHGPTSANCARTTPASSCSRIPNARPRWSTRPISPARPRADDRLCRPQASRARVVLLTECSMSDNVAVEHPDVDFVRPCNLCPHMKRITLPAIRQALETMQHEVIIDPALARARGSRSSGCWRCDRRSSRTRRAHRHHRRRYRGAGDGARIWRRGRWCWSRRPRWRRAVRRFGRKAASPLRSASTTTGTCMSRTRSPPATGFAGRNRPGDRRSGAGSDCGAC